MRQIVTEGKYLLIMHFNMFRIPLYNSELYLIIFYTYQSTCFLNVEVLKMWLKAGKEIQPSVHRLL